MRLDDVFDDIIFNRNLKWGIQNNYLSNIDCMQVDIGFDLSHVRRTKGDFDVGQLAGVLNDARKNEGVVQAYNNYHKGQTLIFAVNVAHAEALASGIDGAVAVTAKTQNRREIIEAFTNREIPCITSVGVFTEGTDLPLVETIINARPTENNSLYCQMVGRGLRLYPGKTSLRLIDCVGIADKRKLCTAPSLLGLDADALPHRQRKKLTGLITDMEEKIGKFVNASPESWIISTRNIDVLAEEENVDTHRVNWKTNFDGSFVCSYGRARAVISPVNELGLCDAYYVDGRDIGYFGKNISLQEAFDRSYAFLSMRQADARMLWDLNSVHGGWGDKPASQKQIDLIRRIFQSPEGIQRYQSDDFDLSSLTRYEASIIIDRLFSDNRDRGAGSQ